MESTQPADKLILHGLVVTMDDQLTVIDDGAVAIVGAKIAAVGASDSLSWRSKLPDRKTCQV
jgi:cytosine/adenosine deaminase-related metal-dependent hydrolase